MMPGSFFKTSLRVLSIAAILSGCGNKAAPLKKADTSSRPVDRQQTLPGEKALDTATIYNKQDEHLISFSQIKKEWTREEVNNKTYGKIKPFYVKESSRAGKKMVITLEGAQGACGFKGNVAVSEDTITLFYWLDRSVASMFQSEKYDLVYAVSLPQDRDYTVKVVPLKSH